MDYRPQLDGLRTFAVSGVLYAHFVDPYSPLGHMGVQLFFVISGFLITGMLLDARGVGPRAAALPLRNFFARRTLRLWPIFYLATGLAIAADLDGVRETAIWHLLFATNILFWVSQNWEPWVLDHYWSLGIEEQFYLVWPFLIYWTSRRTLGWLIPLVALASWGALLLADARDWLGNPDLLGMLLPLSMTSLALGALLALWRRQDHRALRWLPAAGLIAAALCLASSLWQGAITGAGLLLEAVAWMALVHGAVRGFGGLGGALLDWGPIRYTGRISYGIYLYHGLVIYALGSSELLQLQMELGPQMLLVGTAISIAVAALSWHLIELPLSRLKRFFPFAATVAPAAGHPAPDPPSEAAVRSS